MATRPWQDLSALEGCSCAQGATLVQWQLDEHPVQTSMCTRAVRAMVAAVVDLAVASVDTDNAVAVAVGAVAAVAPAAVATGAVGVGATRVLAAVLHRYAAACCDVLRR